MAKLKIIEGCSVRLENGKVLHGLERGNDGEFYWVSPIRAGLSRDAKLLLTNLNEICLNRAAAWDRRGKFNSVCDSPFDIVEVVTTPTAAPRAKEAKKAKPVDPAKEALRLAGVMADHAVALVGGKHLNGRCNSADIDNISEVAAKLRKAVEAYNNHISRWTLEKAE